MKDVFLLNQSKIMIPYYVAWNEYDIFKAGNGWICLLIFKQNNNIKKFELLL